MSTPFMHSGFTRHSFGCEIPLQASEPGRTPASARERCPPFRASGGCAETEVANFRCWRSAIGRSGALPTVLHGQLCVAEAAIRSEVKRRPFTTDCVEKVRNRLPLQFFRATDGYLENSREGPCIWACVLCTASVGAATRQFVQVCGKQGDLTDFGRGAISNFFNTIHPLRSFTRSASGQEGRVSPTTAFQPCCS